MAEWRKRCVYIVFVAGRPAFCFSEKKKKGRKDGRVEEEVCIYVSTIVCVLFRVRERVHQILSLSLSFSVHTQTRVSIHTHTHTSIGCSGGIHIYTHIYVCTCVYTHTHIMSIGCSGDFQSDSRCSRSLPQTKRGAQVSLPKP
jgi:hypothetical protein